MRPFVSVVLAASWLAWSGRFQDSFAFLPQHSGRTRRAHSTSSLYVRRIPPISPPPPPQASDHQDFLQSVAAELKDALERLDVSQLHTQLMARKAALLDDGWTNLQSQVEKLDAQILAKAGELVQVIERDVDPSLQPLLQKLSGLLRPLLSSLIANPSLSVLASAVVSYMVISSLLNWNTAPAPSQPYPLGRYDPISARLYFDQRLPQVILRAVEIMIQSSAFGLKILKDKVENKITSNEYQRGQELAQLLTKLGPTFIKVGQSLSIRTDLLSPAYARGLSTLQDQVPPFSTREAQQILEEAWGKPVTDVLLAPLSERPVAAASLGQVYKCQLRESDQTVAIKVQRPNIQTQIALDMHLLREVAPLVKRLFSLNSDTVGTVDAWGAGFVDELDYIQEGDNAEYFLSAIAETPLKEVVFAPRVVKEWTTTTVLVTEWVDGERLDRSSNEDVTVLCSIAMNTYLTMLLELGLLHCDPHPGNLLRTTDGRLCILDWGMVTRLDRDLQLTLIEHVAHLTSADYAEIPRDLLLLDFIPPHKADLIEDSGVVELLADIYSSWTKGGGAAAINVNDVVNRLQDLTAEKGNLFQIPPYFAYIAKSFSVLEGIGLSNDPKYSIIKECLPYISKRLLTDKERMGPALSTFIFGSEKSSSDRIVDYKRVEQLVEGFGEYTTSTSGALLGKESASQTELLEGAADQILDLVFTEEETPLQQIVLEQLAKIIASNSRSVFTQIRERSGVLPSGRTVLGTVMDPLGIWRTSPLVRVNELDERTVETTRKIISLLQRQIAERGGSQFDLSTLSRQEIMQLSSILVQKVWDRRMGVLQTGGRLARQLLQLTADKLERGERDTRRLPERPLLIEQEAPTSSQRNQLAPTRSFESDRLQQARRRIEELEFDEVVEVVRVRTDIY